MALTLTKSAGKPAAKSAAKKTPKGQLSEEAVIAQKVDRMVELTALIAAVEPAQKELSGLVAFFREAADTKPAEEAVSFPGTNFCYAFDPKKNMRTIKNMKAVAKAMGPELFMEVAKVGLADIDKYLSPAQKNELLEESKSGSRTGKLVPTK